MIEGFTRHFLNKNAVDFNETARGNRKRREGILVKSARVTSKGVNRIIFVPSIEIGLSEKIDRIPKSSGASEKSHIETRYGGTTFVNVVALTRWSVRDHATHHSRLFMFEDGSDRASIGCFMHTDEYKPQVFYEEKKVVVRLTKPFSYTG